VAQGSTFIISPQLG